MFSFLSSDSQVRTKADMGEGGSILADILRVRLEECTT